MERAADDIGQGCYWTLMVCPQVFVSSVLVCFDDSIILLNEHWYHRLTFASVFILFFYFPPFTVKGNHPEPSRRSHPRFLSGFERGRNLLGSSSYGLFFRHLQVFPSTSMSQLCRYHPRWPESRGDCDEDGDLSCEEEWVRGNAEGLGGSCFGSKWGVDSRFLFGSSRLLLIWKN